METRFKGQIVTRDAILRALSAFDAHYPDTNAYDQWLDKATYQYAIHYNGKLYPPKPILKQVTGLDSEDFGGSEQTNAVFRALGFAIVIKP